MATPYKNDGTDFDDIFEPLGAETKRADVGYLINGADISNRYYPLTQGGTAVSGIKYSSNGTSLGDLFAAKGSVSFWDIDLSALSGGYFHSNVNDAQDWALVEIIFFQNGDIRYRDNSGGSELIVGNWYGTNGDDTNTEWRVEVLSINEDTSASGTNEIVNFPTTYTSADSGTDLGFSVYTEGGAGTGGSSTVGDRIDVDFRLYFRETGNPASEITRDVNMTAVFNNGPL